jgi:hypothetical protein
MATSNLQQAAAPYPAPRTIETGQKRTESLGKHIRRTLESRHATSPTFLTVLSKISDAELVALDAEHHAAQLTAFRAEQSRFGVRR